MKNVLSKKQQNAIAQERITILFREAETVFNKNPSLSHRYVTLARKLAMKIKTRIPPELKRKFCKHCYKYLFPGKNARIRTREGKLIIYCQECKKHTRIPLKKK